MFDNILIDEDTAAVFANDDFLVHTDVELVLWRDFVIASTAGVTFNLYDGETVSCALPDTFISGEQAFFYKGLALL